MSDPRRRPKDRNEERSRERILPSPPDCEGADNPSLEPVSAMGKYELIEEIGRGAMARVFRVRDTFSERVVAVKIARPDASHRGERRARIARKLFFNEARAAGLLEHPNIVELLDAGVQDHVRYLVMEYIPGGRTLYEHVSPSTLLPVDDVVVKMLRLAIAFDYAHRRGVIHRDVKPRNIFLDPAQTVKIGDFGVAMVIDAGVDETQVTGYVGSPLYMSTEQIRGETVSTQADLFALGTVMYELLCGCHPFAAGSIDAILRKITRESHVPVTAHRPDVPPVLSRIVDRTLKKHPAGRYQTGLDLAGDLSLIYDHVSVSNSVMTVSERFEAARLLEFFEPFSDAEIWEVLQACQWLNRAAGGRIVGMEHELDAFYVVVRGQVAQAIGEIGDGGAKDILEKVAREDESKHVRHRAELALDRLEQGAFPDKGLADQWASIDEKTFNQAEVGKPAPDFELKDTDGKTWRLSDFKNKKGVLLIWIFADWCPVCQVEYQDLLLSREQFAKLGVQVFTVECHDRFRCLKMVGNRDIWWHHLVDATGAVAAMYNVAPMEFIVHDEWINRPSTIYIDRDGIVRFAYYGTYWGDRPTIDQTLEMIRTNTFDFVHPKRRKP